MHKTGWNIALKIVINHSSEHEIPNLDLNLVSLEKKFGAIVSWFLNVFGMNAGRRHHPDVRILESVPRRLTPGARESLHIVISQRWNTCCMIRPSPFSTSTIGTFLSSLLVKQRSSRGTGPARNSILSAPKP